MTFLDPFSPILSIILFRLSKHVADSCRISFLKSIFTIYLRIEKEKGKGFSAEQKKCFVAMLSAVVGKILFVLLVFGFGLVWFCPLCEVIQEIMPFGVLHGKRQTIVRAFNLVSPLCDRVRAIHWHGKLSAPRTILTST